MADGPSVGNGFRVGQAYPRRPTVGRRRHGGSARVRLTHPTWLGLERSKTPCFCIEDQRVDSPRAALQKNPCPLRSAGKDKTSQRAIPGIGNLLAMHRKKGSFGLPPPQRANERNGSLWSNLREKMPFCSPIRRYGALWQGMPGFGPNPLFPIHTPRKTRLSSLRRHRRPCS